MAIIGVIMDAVLRKYIRGVYLLINVAHLGVACDDRSLERYLSISIIFTLLAMIIILDNI